MENSNYFVHQELKKTSFLKRLLGLKEKSNAIIEINNLFAEKGLKNVSIEEINSLVKNYKVNLKFKFYKDLLNFYKTILKTCSETKKLTDEIKADLDCVKNLFQLNEHDLNKLQSEILSNIYQTEIRNTIETGSNDKNYKNSLLNIQNDLNIPDTLALTIYQKNVNEYISKIIDKIISNQIFPPEEEAQLAQLISNFGINYEIDYNHKLLLSKYRLFWDIQNGNLPVCNVPINLQKGEICHFATKINWLEERKVTKRINYSGLTARTRIAKGVYWRAGSIKPQVISQDVWTLIDIGELYLTSKRLIFMGQKGGKTINLNKILDYLHFSNGVEIQKDAGKSPFLKFDTSVDVFVLILGTLINRS